MSRIYITNRTSGFRFSDDVEADNLSALTPENLSAAYATEDVFRAFEAAPFGLGDWVETWAKPIGCLIDRCTGKFPEWLVKPRPFKGMRLVPRKPRLQPWTLAWLKSRAEARLSRIPRAKYWPLPHQLRTGFCKGTCGCNARKRVLNVLIPDLSRRRFPALF